MARARNFLIFTTSALVTASAIVACDRGTGTPSTRVADNTAIIEPRSPPPAVHVPVEESTGPRAAAPPAAALTDSAITGRIESAIRSDPAMQGADVSVNTDDGVVVMTGVVKNYEQTGVASAHAQRQDGVMRVDNQLSVAPG